jgi:DNA-binding MarR family transcriptional regulator
MRMTAMRVPKLGELIQRFVNRVSHAEGRTLAILSEVSVTLHQVLLPNKLGNVGGSTLTEMAHLLRMSAPSISQMIDRLVEIDLVARAEDQADRRRKRIALTPKGRRLLKRLYKARSADYLAGIAPLSQGVRADLARALAAALSELE